MNKQISIIGCGWLGLPLAEFLFEKGYNIKGSTTSTTKIEQLTSHHIQGFLVKLTSKGVEGAIDSCLENSSVLVLNTPPGLHKNPDANYVKQIELLIPYIEKSSIENVLFISSISVYEDDETMPVITEKSCSKPMSNSGNQLLKAEALLKKNPHFKTTILRFSGLFGKDRHPAIVLSGRKNLKNPEAPVNLIHQQDCIEIIHSILEQGIWNETLNASTAPHPQKKEYYTSVCNALNLPIPEFEMHSTSKGKQIDSKKLIQILNYSFKIKL